MVDGGLARITGVSVYRNDRINHRVEKIWSVLVFYLEALHE